MKSKDQILLEEAYNRILLKEESYLDKLIRLNPKWSPETAKSDFSDEYDSEDAQDIEDHVDYEENAAEWIDNISRFVPGVRVGDWVKVYVQGGGGVKKGWYIGKIEEESTTRANSYGYGGYKGPSIIPSWSIRVFVPINFDDFLDGTPGTYALDSKNKQAYASRGHINCAQHDEIQSNTGAEQYKTYTKEQTFTKLNNQSLILKEVD
jgi:hypothetical protein